uniref:Uncharacterized protein n=1 Tax=Parascaris equorum TaxID=6256 RepID=A0A914RL74_PAREQ
MEFQSKKFQSAINQIPQCDWIERAHEMEKRLGRDCAFSVAKQVHNCLSKIVTLFFLVMISIGGSPYCAFLR